MLDISGNDEKLVPPEYHVQAILEILESQLNQTGFIDKGYGQDHWLRHHVIPSHDTGRRYPFSEAMDQIVSALRSLARLGDGEFDNVVFICYYVTHG